MLAGFVLPDVVVERVLRQGWAAVRRDPRRAVDAFVGYGDQESEQLLTLFSQRPIAVFEGWPMDEAQIPGIGVTIQQAAENAGEQQIGPRGVFREGNSQVTYWGTRMNAGVQLSHYAPTQRGASAMAMVSAWILFQARLHMETNEGLAEQTVTIADYNPNTSFAPENAFMRLVILNCSYENTWSEAESPLIASISWEVLTDEE